MPIYEQTYRRYEARAPLRKVRFWPITREALRLILARRWFLGLLALGWLPFLVRVIHIYVVTRFPEANRVLPVDGRLFGQFLSQQLVPVLFVTIFAGAGLVANDLRTGAVLVYLSRPLTRRDYVAGKLLVVLLLNLFLTLVPALLLYLIALALAPDQFLKWELAWIGPAIALYALVLSAVLGLLMLAVSSLSRSARVAGLGFFGLLMGLQTVHTILREAFDRPEAAVLSIATNIQSIGRALFGTAERTATVPWPWAALALVALGAGCLAVLRSRVRAVEIVT
ncbi:MAG TPA: ABC transporter permease subunit [Vicinamibacteria bacterium]|nr:ABC transporter permease subunit [Vicinamibacteria bacterium]